MFKSKRRRYVTSVEAEMEQAFPRGASFFIHETAVNQVKAERSIKPESIALGVFGAIAALAALLIAGQAIGRQLRLDDDELHTMRALGAGPAVTSTDGLLGVFYSVVAGALLAAAVAVVMSPLWPIGPVRPLYPSRGIAADWTVLAVGAAALVAVLSTVSVALAYRRAPHRVAARAHATPRPSAVAGGASAAGLPASAVAGIRLALESRRDSDSVPMRSAIIGAALALIVVITTVTFGASLGTLVTHPALYGWNWDYMLTQDQGGGNILGTQSAKLLGRRSRTSPLRRGTPWTHCGSTARPFQSSAESRTRRSRLRSSRATGSMPSTRSCWDRRRWPRCTSTWATPWRRATATRPPHA